MIDLALDPLNHDLLIQDNDLVFLDGAERVRQHIDVKLKLWQGEWFLDTEFGTPYLASILSKQISLAAAVAALKASILAVDGVQTITRFDYTFNRSARDLDVSFDVLTPFGNLSIIKRKPKYTTQELIAISRSENFPLADDNVDILTNTTIPSNGY